ncbi:hypothetical protein ACG0Z6_09375 [Roseateles sp. BYS180W]|uniref:4Fe-4S ferredoxin-type domain-containing protein n=1 Tax=Roseateles rivi TaxID=3299028 RepID=A0ABW7FVV5_9BURK
MRPPARIVHIHSEAPPKPPAGAACNGCGLCCLSEPCPLGGLASRRWHGPCTALRWSEPERLYRCGMLSQPWQALGWPAHWPMPEFLNQVLVAVARRWIAAGIGCDADLQSEQATDKS